MALGDTERAERGQAVLYQGARDAAAAMIGQHDEMLQIAAPAVMAGHDATRAPAGHLRDEAQARIAVEISARGIARICVPDRYARGAPHEVHHGVVVFDAHRTDGEHAPVSMPYACAEATASMKAAIFE